MKRILFIALLGLIGCGVQVDSDTYKPVGHQYDRTDGWFVDSDNVMYYFVNGVKSGAQIDTSGNFTTTGTLTYTNLSVSGTLAAGGAAALASTLTVVSQTVDQPFQNFRIFDGPAAHLTNVASDDDDLTFILGTPGTTAATLESMDCGGLNDTTQKALFYISIPPTYLTGSTITLKTNVGMQSVVADQSATLDIECWVPDYDNEDTTVSGDLITTAEQSVNNTTFAIKSFVLDDDAANYVLLAGDTVQCLMTVLCDDDGNAGNDIIVRLMYLHVVYST